MNNNYDDFEDENGMCVYCEWRPEYVESHIEFSMQGYGIEAEKRCKYLDSKYRIWINKNGEVEFKKK